jgi:tetratricopeptide (TPR) repeat protein
VILPAALVVAALFALPAVSQAATQKGPDLTVTRASLSAGAVDVTVRNAGTATAKPSTAHVVARVAGKRARLGTAKVRRLPAGRKASVQIAVRRPTAPGVYPLTVCADGAAALTEAREANNCRSAGRLTVAAPEDVPAGTPTPTPVATATPTTTPAGPPPDAPDLAATDVSDPPGQVKEGGSFALDDTVTNAVHTAGASTTRFYLSPDAHASLAERADTAHALADIVMGGARDVPPLGPGASSSSAAPTTVTVPPGTRPGVYHVLACADDREALVEADEGDNCVEATHLEGGQVKPSLVEVVAEDQQYRIDSFSDVYDPSQAEVDPAVCADTATGSFATVDAAVASADAFLEAKAPAAMDAFEASAEYGDPLALQEAAGAAIVQDAPAAALAALLRAHELEPAEASHLVNAAPIAAGLGMPAQALAFLDEARRLDDSDLPAMGISRHAVALANRGQALALLGRYGEAERALKAALQAEPLLTEAQGSLAVVELCGKQDPDAATDRVRLAATRQGPRPLDATRGVASALRNIEFPGFPEQAVPMEGYFQAISQKLGNESIAFSQRFQQLNGAVNAKFPDWTRAQRNRYAGVLRRYTQAQSEDDLKAERAAYQAKLDEAQQTTTRFWLTRYPELLFEASDACEGSQASDCFEVELSARCRPALNSAHQEWVDHMDESYALAKTYYAHLSKRVSGYASHLSDADAHALALLSIQQSESNLSNQIIGPALLWTNFVSTHQDLCVETVEPTAPQPADPAAAASEGECPPLLKSISAVLDVGAAKLKVNCEAVKLEISSGPAPWIKGFAEIEYKFKTQRVTVCAGVKGEISAGVAKGSFKSGFYTVVDSQGIQDVGWRVGPSLTVAGGPVEFKLKDEIDMSLIGDAGSGKR